MTQMGSTRTIEIVCRHSSKATDVRMESYCIEILFKKVKQLWLNFPPNDERIKDKELGKEPKSKSRT